MTLAVLLAGFALADDAVTLEVSLSGLRNDDGLIRVAVHESKTTFPGEDPPQNLEAHFFPNDSKVTGVVRDGRGDPIVVIGRVSGAFNI